MDDGHDMHMVHGEVVIHQLENKQEHEQELVLILAQKMVDHIVVEVLLLLRLKIVP
ncbi:MAG: hypothetical protein ACPHY8_03500 [Patescibacteria group bacterium]